MHVLACGVIPIDFCSALEDANSALRLDTSWPKGYYRRGRAYAGLKVGKPLVVQFLKPKLTLLVALVSNTLTIISRLM